MIFFSAIYYGVVYVFFCSTTYFPVFFKSNFIKKTVSFRKVWFSIPVFIGKVYFYLVIP